MKFFKTAFTVAQRLRWALLALAVVVCLVPALAAAQNQAPATVQQAELSAFELGESDMSKLMLDSIFGQTNKNAEVPFLGAAMRVFNIFALTFGTFMFTLVAVVGTLNTAQDGELLGRKWSTMWVPIRFVVGVAMLVPLASGYSSAQHGVLYLANVGSGAASMVWSKAMDGFSGSMVQNAAYLPENRRLVEGLMRDVLRAQVCNATLSQRYSDGSVSTDWVRSAPGYSEAGKSTFGITAYEVTRSNIGLNIYSWELRFGDKWKQSDVGGEEDCGYIKTGAFSTDKNDWTRQTQFDRRDASGNVLRGSKTYSGVAAHDNGETNAALKTLYKAQATAIANEANAFIPLATEIAKIQESAVSSAARPDYKQKVKVAISAAAERYLATMDPQQKNVTGAVRSKLDSFLKDSANTGWLMAGATFFQMASIQSMANEAVRSVPSYADGSMFTSRKELDISRVDMKTDLEAMNSMINAGFQGDSTDIVNPGDMTAKAFGRWFAYNPDNSDHALVQLKNTGDLMMGGAQGLAIAVYAAERIQEKVDDSETFKEVMDVVKKSSFLSVLEGLFKEFVKIIVPIVYIVAGAMFVAGITMSIVLPTLPFALSLGAIAGWLMAVFSAVVAAPIWLAGHLHPDGDGFAGQRAAGGYLILLETVTRPLFIIFGLMGAFVIMDPIMKFTSFAFASTLNSVQADSTTGLVSIVVFVVMYITIIWTIVRTLLTLTNSLGEKVYIWIGGQFAGYDQAGSFASAHQAATGRASDQVFGAAKSLGQQILRRGDDGERQGGVNAGPSATQPNTESAPRGGSRRK